MNLLPIKDVKDLRAQEQARDILRTQEINDALNRANKSFAKSQADFNSMLARNREAWAQEEAQHATRVAEMNNDIAKLEIRKAEALAPVTEIYAQARNKLKEGMEIIVKNEQWSATLSETAELLEEKLSDVGEREVDVSNREDKVLIKEQANEVETNIIKNGMEALQKQQSDLALYKKQEELVIAKRKEELRLKEINLEAREEKIRQSIEEMNRTTVQIADQWEQIKRERERNIPV